MSQPLTSTTSFLTADGLTLEGERSTPQEQPVRAAVVLCHPHPAHGGTMRSVVVSPLFESLPAHGLDVLRFNFRGVERSQGAFDDGGGEQLDVEAALVEHRGATDPTVPLFLIGFSFGADLALSSPLDIVDGYCAIAPPLRFGQPECLADDPRPKHIVLAAHDDFRDPQWVIERTDTWVNTTVTSVAGANHFFVARVEPLLERVIAFIDANLG